MSKATKYIKTKINFLELISLYRKQRWLLKKEDSLEELLYSPKNRRHKKLLVNLLQEFKYLSNDDLSEYLKAISDYIINKSTFTEAQTQIAAMTFDEEADSSQKVLDYIKMPLFKNGWFKIKTVNSFPKIVKFYNKGFTQIILIDEFIGSGKTLISRLKNLEANILGKFEIKICFIAGMDNAIKLIEEQGYEVFCPLRLPKGISERFKDEDVENANKSMLEIEATLAKNVSKYELSTYSFGYNKAEATYSLEGCQGNTPNSVFPVFWWPKNIAGKERNTLLTRFEKGLK